MFSSPRLLKQTLNSLENIVISTIKGEHLFWCNQHTLDVLGYDSIEDLLKEYPCICDFFIEDKKKGYIGKTVGTLNWLDYALAHQDKQDIKVKLNIHGKIEIHSLKVHPLDYDEQLRYVVIMQNITQLEKTSIALKKYQIQLQNKNRLYEELFDNAPIAYQALDKNGYIVKVNKKWKKLLNIETDYLGKHFSEFLSKETAPDLKEDFSRFQKQGYMDDAEFELVDQKNGSLTPIRVYGNLSYYENGVLDHTNCLLYDLSKERQQERELKENFESVMLSFVNILEEKDIYTAGHSRRVAKYSRQIAKNMALSAEDIDIIFRAGNLHDIGKIVTPESILLKPSKFNQGELQLMQEHAHSGFSILNQMASYKFIATIIRHHHERYDGKGYPDGLEGEKIPLLSRIMAVADAFDAMTTNRVYKPRMEIAEAIKELENNSGTQFDPKIIPYAKQYFSTLKTIDFEEVMPTDPKNTHRFAYFFKDLLTNVYNGDYLNVFLHDDIKASKYTKIHIIDLHHLHNYNNKYGWEAGNHVLIDLAHHITEQYKTQMVFRVHGDKFVVLCPRDNTIESAHFELPPELDFSIREVHIQKEKITSFQTLLPFITCHYQ
ncbi:HD domain-containing phosphohydrolase [Sulfurospirillum sp. 1612]|uniref:HD domain-containing phosphohydrolase n=1 Tax=Sulfurospirillum sp. 1612 TaxID=3094835 RepID=UPI002F95BA35